MAAGRRNGSSGTEVGPRARGRMHERRDRCRQAARRWCNARKRQRGRLVKVSARARASSSTAAGSGAAGPTTTSASNSKPPNASPTTRSKPSRASSKDSSSPTKPKAGPRIGPPLGRRATGKRQELAQTRAGGRAHQAGTVPTQPVQDDQQPPKPQASTALSRLAPPDDREVDRRGGRARCTTDQHAQGSTSVTVPAPLCNRRATTGSPM